MTAFAWAVNAADTLLRAFGQTATITQAVIGTYNPVTDTTTSTTNTATLKIVVDPPETADWAKGELTEANQRKLLVPAKTLTFTLLPGDIWSFGGQEWTAVDVRQYAPDGTAIMYEVMVKR